MERTIKEISQELVEAMKAGAEQSTDKRAKARWNAYVEDYEGNDLLDVAYLIKEYWSCFE